jgi:hypothetical protein
MSKFLAIAVGAAVCVAFAAGAASAVTDVTVEPVSFTIPAGQCADLPPTLSVSGTGTARIRAHSSLDAQGRVHETLGTVITGTATDSLGGTYRFNYHNSLSLSAAADFPFVAHITDHFNLVGSGGASQIHTFFNIEVLITGPDSSEVLSFHSHGDPETCDPL